jgi:hypothetical protein
MKRICGLAALAALGAVAVAVLASATGGATGPGLSASVLPTNPGPLHACATAPTECPLNTVTQLIIYTQNTNRPVNWLTGPITRPEIPNAYAVSSVDARVAVNGVDVPEWSGTFTPPPTAIPPGFAGRWPVSCAPFTSPCDVRSPAVLPGETTAPLVSRWIHGVDDPDGTYVFTFTLNGTLNGEPVEVTASSKKIVMTR